MNSHILKIISPLLMASQFCFAGQSVWSEGFGQGNLEYFIDVRGARLIIGCPTENGSATSNSSVSLVVQDKEISKFEITVKNIKYNGPFDAASRVGVDNFTSLLDSLKRGDAVVTYGKNSIIFPKSNAGKVLPTYGKKGFECNLNV